MSTTATGPEAPLRQRLGLDGLLRRRGRGRAPGLGGTRPAQPRGQVPPTDTKEARQLLTQAENAGRRAATDGTLNPYVIGSVHRLPYFGRLIALRGHTRDRVVALHHGHEERELRASADLAAMTAERETAARRAREAQEEERRRRQAATSRLDRISARLAAREDRRDRLLPWMASRVAGGRDTTTGPDGELADTTGPGADPLDDTPDDSEWRVPVAPEPGPRISWEGLPESAALARLPRLILAALLVLVELPVYITLFLAIHDGTPEGRASAFLLSAAVGLVMTAAPFQAGRQWRRHASSAALWIVVPVALALISLWAGAAWYLGDLRARIVFRDTSSPALEEQARQLGIPLPSAPTTLEQLHLDQHTVSVTFIALLLMSGGIAFLLALSEEHPFIAAYRHHGRRLKKAETALASAEAAIAVSRREQETWAERRHEREQALMAELAAIDAVYEAAAHAYLDGVQAASHDPAVTEGAMRLSSRYPLLPEPTASNR
ncbi:hypothetical protein ACF1AO_12460 [Streptomyces longwoodensis]|uniref:hypothetical protein n=1 Tax=Streptomyces longwoodensis TaxID=68231 RepID=UPI0036F7E059